jgi:hypothetical protein
MYGLRNCSAWVTLLALALLGTLGCGNGNGKYQDYLPPEDSAREALETALDAWKDGRRPGKIDADPVPIEVVDLRWKAGKKLTGYEILSSEPPKGTGPTWFSVKLLFQGTPAEKVVRYVVIGKSPLWVYTEEDYKQLTGM